jgi:mono/diheme cytochrome c family protein
MKQLGYSVEALLALACLLTPNILGAQSPPRRDLNEQQIRGEGLFLQRCSLCHLSQAQRLLPNAKPLGPSLISLLRDAGPARERAVREIILKGGPQMPGFQHGLTQANMDDLIAYLRTL